MYKVLLVIILFLSYLDSSAQMEFVENKGQWNENVNYKGDFSTGNFFLEKNGFTVLMNNPEDLQRISDLTHGEKKASVEPFNFRSFAYKVKFVGSSKNPEIVPDKNINSYNNYFIGNDKSKWASECKIFQAVTYKNVYPNIDVRYYSQGSSLKYDFIIYPGGNPDLIAINYAGPKLSIKSKELIISTPVGEVKELSPYSYQPQGTGQAEVKVDYILKNNLVTFKIKGYDPKAVLIIDPSVIFSTFTGSTADNWGYTATPGPDGSFFAAGVVFGANGGAYPVSPGAFQTQYGGGINDDTFGGYDIAIIKFSPNGANRIYATYLGGSGNEQPHSMITDSDGNLILAGRSNSVNFPLTRAAIGSAGATSIIITKFNSAGSALIGSVKIGGSRNDGINIRAKYTEPLGRESLRLNYGDDARSEVILDKDNNIILASCTQSPDFPIRNSTIQTTFGGGLQDGVILKFNPNLSNLVFSTFFGGSANDACFVAGINPLTSEIYIGGATESSDLPGNKIGVMQPSYQGGAADGFITAISPDGSSIFKTTYQGTSGTDVVFGLKFDKQGFPYTMGTTSGNWPIENAVFSQTGGKQFITKIKQDLSGYVYSTVFGTNSAEANISPVAFLVDRCENVYVSGWGGGLNNSQGYNNGTTRGLSEVNPLSNIPPPDGADFYFFVLKKDAESQLFGSHFGHNGGLGDHVDGGTSRFDENGIIYMAICSCGGGGPFPTTPGSWATSNGSSKCNEAAIKIEMDFAGIGSGIRTSINAVVGATKGCIPIKVDFADTLRMGQIFYWSFGDGTFDTTNSFTVSHNYMQVGSYNVRLIAEDSMSCNVRDTSYVTIRAGNKEVTPDFTFHKTLPCESLGMVFTNNSTASAGAFGPKGFVWDYGDGSPLDTAGFNPARTHVYPGPGTYYVTLRAIDTLFCNTPVDTVKRVSLNPVVKAIFTTPAKGCLPYNAIFKNESLAGTDFIWDFGDGTTSTDFEPVHLYANAGTYNVRLIAKDTNTCNKIDTSAYFTISLYNSPKAIISSWQPNPPQPNTPVQFTNGSIGANSYLWYFGDMDSSNLINPSHQYNSTGTFKADLIAFNVAGCPDTATVTVKVIVNPLLDVPNAFTPGKFGENSVISIKGFGIDKMDWRIYNRWGQLVFQTNNRKLGWDGTFKGKLQPMDVYVYTLDVEFFTGEKLKKTGDITLLR